MKVQLRKMSKDEFDIFSENSINDSNFAYRFYRGCKIFCVYGNETFRIRIRYVGVFVGFCNRIFCRIYLSGYSISRLLSFIHASSIFTC